jgi:hypothetical protein
MDSLTLKLILTPVLVGAASLAARRWGSTVSGWLVALPLTSGPIVFFLVLTHGVAFAKTVAVGTLAGAISQAAFCLTYSWLATHWGWPRTLGASCLGFVAATAILQHLIVSLLALFLLVNLALALTLHLMPSDDDTLPTRMTTPPQWDIPTRMVVATAFVLLLTGAAPILGAELTGLLAPYPLYGTILAIFAHHQGGPMAAIRTLRGLLLGLFSFAGFFLVLATLLDRSAVAVAFGAAGAVALTTQAGTLWMLRRRTA